MSVFSLLVIVHALAATVWTGGHLVLDLGVLPRALRAQSAAQIRAFEEVFEPLGLTALAIHLVFAVSTLVLWVWVVWEAFLRFPVPPMPGSHGPRHRVMARLAALDLVLTAITGTVFYWLAFVASR